MLSEAYSYKIYIFGRATTDHDMCEVINTLVRRPPRILQFGCVEFEVGTTYSIRFLFSILTPHHGTKSKVKMGERRGARIKSMTLAFMI